MAFSFFSWLISFITGRPDPERERKRVLKWTTKMLAANKYGNFYRTKTEEVSPEFARFFFDIYKVVSPAQAVLRNAAQSNRLKLYTIHAFLDETQLAILERLTPANIELRAQNTPSASLAHEMQDEFDCLAEGFDPERVNAIDGCYTLILGMAKFVAYDFYFLLRKFDSQLSERTLNVNPLFVAIQGAAVSDDIKDFLELSAGLDMDRDWDAALRVLKNFKGADVVNPKLWDKILAEIQEVKRAGILEILVRIITRDPDWGWDPRLTREHITGEYLETIRHEIFEILTRITTAKQDARVVGYAKRFFGDITTDRLAHYNDKNNEQYKKRNFNGFTFARGLNYLQVFLLDEGPQVQFLSDLILIRGQWISPTLFRPLSDAVRLLVSIPDMIKALDDSLSDHGAYGPKLERALTKAEHSKSQIRNINATLDHLNNDARLIITDAIFNLSVIEDTLKDILEDYRRPISLIILNWGELETFSNGDLEGRIDRMHKRLEEMLHLLHLVVQDSDEEAETEAEAEH
ncbi:hypothetical protein AGMMS49942_25680 [Spirochaetia bacterium]|nr:hypothetical protein AGMMS49942_25680 [Spirochaetia bacterium]